MSEYLMSRGRFLMGTATGAFLLFTGKKRRRRYGDDYYGSGTYA